MNIKTGVYKNCMTCNELVYVPRWRIAKFKTCSKNCMHKAMIGRISPMKNKKHTEEAISKISRTWFKEGFEPWNKEISGYHTQKASTERINKTKESLRKAHASGKVSYKNYIRGRKHHWWKGGASKFCYLLENSTKYRIWRRSVFIRDNRTCLECGSIDNINAHHIKALSIIYQDFLSEYSQFSPIEDKEVLLKISESYLPFWDINNGQTLCSECHKKTDNFGPKYYWKIKNEYK